jgi:hypothetical protein
VPTGIGKSLINVALANLAESAFYTTPQKKLRHQLENQVASLFAGFSVSPQLFGGIQRRLWGSRRAHPGDRRLRRLKTLSRELGQGIRSEIAPANNPEADPSDSIRQPSSTN